MTLTESAVRSSPIDLIGTDYFWIMTITTAIGSCLSRDWVNPADRVKSNGGRTAMIRKCEAIWKPQLKSQRSYSYKGADLIAQGGNKIKVVVKYTATNSFNARVPGTFTCNFGG